MKVLLLAVFFLLLAPIVAQKTIVSGRVTEMNTGNGIPFAKVQFVDTKIGVYTDSLGFYRIESYYALDSIRFSMGGYQTLTLKIEKDKIQEINARLKDVLLEFGEVTVRPPDELPSTRLHKRVVRNKEINNKEKLQAYEYEVYNKMQLDLNNIGENFGQKGISKRLDLVLNYLDSSDQGKTYLPVLLSESISDYYYKKSPQKKKEIVKASQITGIENLQINQFMGDMYLDINIYDNTINMFQRAFISPCADFARNHYRFYLEDSTFIGNNWCYKLRFVPKRVGELTFEGEMWIHDTTYAVRRVSATLSDGANINLVNNLYFEHEFEQVAPEVWMLVSERMIVDANLTKNAKTYGFFGRKYSSRKKYKVNYVYEDAFYKSENTVTILDSAGVRSKEYWKENRHIPLSIQEDGINKMVDSLENTPFFNRLKNLTYLATTGYYPLGYVELGSVTSLVSYNQVEHLRLGLALRTSNKFSKRLELGGRAAYGFYDEKMKYAGSIRYNITPKKRGMLSTYYSYDIEQIGASPTAAAVGSTFGTLFRTGPLNKLTFVSKAGINLEKDIGKDFILFGGFEAKEFTALGEASYTRYNRSDSVFETIKRIRASEFTVRFRWTKDEEFLSGSFDRIALPSKYPILSIQGIFGVKGILGSNYNYQKVEFQYLHNVPIGVLGRIRYGLTAGYVFGTTAYPFLKVHEGNQSYWLLTSTFNKLNFYEFISDRYVSCFIENHWEGLLFDRIPLIRKLKWRLVTSGRMMYGAVSEKHNQEMFIPSFTKRFGNLPYIEANIGIENIFKMFRVDLVYRVTHLEEDMNPLGIRARWAFNF